MGTSLLGTIVIVDALADFLEREDGNPGSGAPVIPLPRSAVTKWS